MAETQLLAMEQVLELVRLLELQQKQLLVQLLQVQQRLVLEILQPQLLVLLEQGLKSQYSLRH